MAYLVVENTKKVLFENSNILKEKYWEESAPGGPKWMGRLQAAAGSHKHGNDPHIIGTALDIILRANIPYELNFADQLIDVFINLQEKMRWNCIVYNRWEWNGRGIKFPRHSKNPKQNSDSSFLHLTHIHLQWDVSLGNHTGFESELSDAVASLSEYKSVWETFQPA